MRKAGPGIALLSVCALPAGCAPQESLFPLFSNTDCPFESQLLGEWIMQGGTEHIKPGDKSGTAIFEKGQDGISYTLTIPEFDEGQKLISTARLARIGTTLFIDLVSSDLDNTQNATIPYPAIEGPAFGRVYLEKDTMHFDFLSDKWVSDQAKAGKLALPCIMIGNQTVL
jgi:hypothetical protein